MLEVHNVHDLFARGLAKISSLDAKPRKPFEQNRCVATLSMSGWRERLCCTQWKTRLSTSTASMYKAMERSSRHSGYFPRLFLTFSSPDWSASKRSKTVPDLGEQIAAACRLVTSTAARERQAQERTSLRKSHRHTWGSVAAWPALFRRS